ncbi:F-box domain-containing protein [Favolaschia claudopus]|uniref:F-box domain-containing protein n=1 Tax=Favolaschia claudopus TaxID=2862362 RepID=A0AAW0CCP2_9AGAR
MPDNSLPDELISEILSPALKVSDEVFSNTDEVSPFSSYGESTSAYLVVCKSWLRVATPLLYNTVVLRSKAQAKALAAALSGNSELGHFIKKLRVEGGFGPSMQTVLRCSPNVTDLFLTLEIYSSDSTAGLCKGLSFVNPSRLVLKDIKYKSLANKMVSQLAVALSQALAKWDKLVVFDCPFQGSYGTAATLLPAITSKQLHTLIIRNIEDSDWAYESFQACPLKLIQVKEPVRNYEREDIPLYNPALMALLRYSEEPSKYKAKAPVPALEMLLIAPPLNPSFVPMANAPKGVQDELWARILYFAMSSRKLSLLLISKSFYRLALPFYYEDVVVRRTQRLSELSSILKRETTLGPCIRTLALAYYDDYYDYYDLDSDDEEFDDVLQKKWLALKSSRADSIFAILSQTNNLVKFGSDHLFDNPGIMDPFISWDAFETLTACSGSTLHEFIGSINSQQHASPIVFNDLKALRVLWWRCNTVFSKAKGLSADALLNLEMLRVSEADSSFLRVLSTLKLPSLRHVVLSELFPNQEIFFKAHGFKLTELSVSGSIFGALGAKLLDYCPNLSILTLSDRFNSNPPDFKHLHPSQQVPSLVKIVFLSEHWISHKSYESQWNDFFTNFKPRHLGGLREMRFKCYVWPTTERDIAKSHWVRWAEIMLAQGVSLFDKNGTKWRPRLKVR